VLRVLRVLRVLLVLRVLRVLRVLQVLRVLWVLRVLRVLRELNSFYFYLLLIDLHGVWRRDVDLSSKVAELWLYDASLQFLFLDL